MLPLLSSDRIDWFRRARAEHMIPRARRVLFPFVGDTVGGSHLSALELVDGLDPARFEPIVAVHRKGKLRSYLSDRGIACERAPEFGRDPLSGNWVQDVAATLMTVPRLVRFLRHSHIDIVHTHDARMHFLWGPAAKLARARFVLHLRARVQSRISVSSRFADSILAISEYCRQEFPPAVAIRAQVVLNPIRPRDLVGDREECRQRLLMAPNGSLQFKAVVGYVANFRHGKRPMIFVEMAARLRNRLGDGLFFPMFGEMDGVRDETIKHQVNAKIGQHDLTSHCVLMGARFPIEPWIMGCDVLVVPAVGDAFGRTLVEAMLCGTPVVAADDGGHREVIRHGETGLLVRADDAAAFAEGVAELLENPQMAKAIASTAKTTALTTYSVESHVERVQSIYDSLP